MSGKRRSKSGGEKWLKESSGKKRGRSGRERGLKEW